MPAQLSVTAPLTETEKYPDDGVQPAPRQPDSPRCTSPHRMGGRRGVEPYAEEEECARAAQSSRATGPASPMGISVGRCNAAIAARLDLPPSATYQRQHEGTLRDDRHGSARNKRRALFKLSCAIAVSMTDVKGYELEDDGGTKQYNKTLRINRTTE